MVVRLQPYNQDLVDELRRNFLEKYPSGDNDFDPRDIARVKKYDKYLYNILITTKSNVDVALGKLEKILKWRKEFEINDITWDSFSNETKQLGPIYCHGRSKQNCRILWCMVKHSKRGDPERTAESKKFLAFWLEKLQWEDFDNPIVIVQDMTGAGVSNMDLEVVKFLIVALELYFPALCDMLYMYEMHWILNAIWKIIEKLLSEQAKEHLRFIKMKDVPTYFAPDQVPEHMGGTDTYKWSYPPPEQFRDTQDDEEEEEGEDDVDDTKMHSVLEFETSMQETAVEDVNTPGPSRDPSREPSGVPSKEPNPDQRTDGGDTLKATENIPLRPDTDVTPRKVHFADDFHGDKENTDPSRSPIKSKTKKKPPAKKLRKEIHVGPLVTTRPGESLIFRSTGNRNNLKELKSTFSLTNTTDSRVAYKVKTTSPDKYRVRPSSGQINPGASISIDIFFRGGESDHVVRDKFLVLSTEYGEDPAKSTAELMEFWRHVSRSTVVEHKLKCICETPPEALITNHDILKELQSLTKKVTKIQEERERKMSRALKMILLLFVLHILLISIIAYMYYSQQPPLPLQQSCYQHDVIPKINPLAE